MQNAVIVDGVRTPIGTFGGVFKDVSASDLAAVALRGALERTGVPAGQVDETVLGSVAQIGENGYLGRLSAVKAGLPIESTAYSVNRQCGSGLQAIISAVEQVRLGEVGTALAGGTEQMSGAPYVLPKARWGYRMGSQTVEDGLVTMLSCPFDHWHMGVTAENVAERFGISREDQDAFALQSQQRTAAAQAAGRFDHQIVPVTVKKPREGAVEVRQDEHPRPETTLDGLAKLRPAFQENGTVTAGNASGINDGAAALVIMDAERAAADGLRPRLRLVASAVAGVEPAIMGMGPAPAIRKALAKAGMTLDDVDLIELNEAFAAQALGVIRDLGLDEEKVNPNGGAIAHGHPVGATGAILTIKLMEELERRNASVGLVSLCIGGGQGIAAIFERLR